MLNGLVAMCILSHTCNLHFFHFMDHSPVSARFDSGGKGKYGIYFGRELLIAPEQIYKSLHIMEYRPSIMPRIALTERPAPLQRVKRFLPFTISAFSPHKTDRRVKYVFIIIHLTGKNFLIMFVSGHLSQLVATEIIVCIFH